MQQVNNNKLPKVFLGTVLDTGKWLSTEPMNNDTQTLLTIILDDDTARALFVLSMQPDYDKINTKEGLYYLDKLQKLVAKIAMSMLENNTAPILESEDVVRILGELK